MSLELGFDSPGHILGANGWTAIRLEGLNLNESAYSVAIGMERVNIRVLYHEIV